MPHVSRSASDQKQSDISLRSVQSSIGLGGGSIVRVSPDSVTIGPDSTGYRLLNEGLVFGGSTLTATDIVVASHRASIGCADLVSHLDQSVVQAAQARIKTMLETAIDTMKTTVDDIPVYLVGGGSVLAPDELVGASKVHRFNHFEVANAVGAAISKVRPMHARFGSATKTRNARWPVPST
jgi:N-methylhydantoinase A/oxoprolinase/acetone carboxylase beta subunit